MSIEASAPANYSVLLSSYNRKSGKRVVSISREVLSLANSLVLRFLCCHKLRQERRVLIRPLNLWFGLNVLEAVIINVNKTFIDHPRRSFPYVFSTFCSRGSFDRIRDLKYVVCVREKARSIPPVVLIHLVPKVKIQLNSVTLPFLQPLLEEISTLKCVWKANLLILLSLSLLQPTMRG